MTIPDADSLVTTHPHTFEDDGTTRDSCGMRANPATWVQCGFAREHHRWPCSPTCTHDDAWVPGHPERVRERSEAVLAAITKCPKCGGDVEEGYGHASGAPQPAPYLYCLASCGWRHTVKGEVVWNPTREQEAWFDSGAEAMRAACLKALRAWCERNGLDEAYQSMKEDIDGATP